MFRTFRHSLLTPEKPVPNEAQLKSANKAAVRAQIDQIRHIRQTQSRTASWCKRTGTSCGQTAAAVESWTAGPGSFSISSFYKWAVGGGVPFLGQVPLGFLFGGTGGSWKA